MDNKYNIEMEIAGPFAMWSRPDTGANPTSYPVPTYSAAKGIFESIAFFKNSNAWIKPSKVEICKRKGTTVQEVSFQKYTTNYKGPLKQKQKSNFQFSSLILSDVCYRLYATIENGSGKPLCYGDNPCHALQEIFNRRLENGQCYKTPCLGWNEFVASYWGPLRKLENESATEINTDINIKMVSILSQVFDKNISGKYNPKFVQANNAIIKNGVFYYD